MSRRRAWSGTLALGIAFLLAFTILALVVPHDPLGAELRWAEWMRDIQSTFLTHVALVFNWLGRGIGRTLVIFVLGLVLAVARRWQALIAFALLESVTPLVSSTVKAAVGRPRPPDGLVHAVGSAFPSGHAAFAATTCVALVLLFTAPGRRRPLWWGLAVAGTLGMAWSRTYLQVHWLLDVIGGSLLGAGVALAVCSLTLLARRD